MTRPIVDASALRAAIEIPSYKERRVALRKLAQAVLERMFTHPYVVDMLRRSPIVGTGEKQIEVRPQISGLRDQFDEAMLIATAYVGTDLRAIELATASAGGHTKLDRALLAQFIEYALIEPSVYAMPSGKSRTGYVFGRHDHLTDRVVDAMRSNIAAAPLPTATPAATPTPTKEMPMSTTVEPVLFVLPDRTSLDQLMNMVDHVALVTHVSRATAAETLQSLMRHEAERDRFEAALEMIGMRETHPTDIADLPPIPTAHVLLVKQAISIIDGIPTAKPTITAPTTTTKESASMTAPLSLPTVDPTIASMIDAMLTSAKLPPLTSLVESIRHRDEKVSELTAKLDSVEHEYASICHELAEVRARPALLTTAEASRDGTIPAGKLTYQPAYKAFGITKGKDAFSFDVPVWEWDGVHPHVPAVDPHYIFRPFELLRVLYAIVSNQRAYLHGHTGTGKTTLIEQVAARLNYPFMRLNFDSEISRMDLIGRDVLTREGETTVSRFVDGILPQMMQSPCIGCFDELDFVRPDIAYVMQRMLEGDALVITEDGGRVVHPHPMFRAFATGNTVGQGDEHGMYQGARVQSTALLDRFGIWQQIDYLKASDRDALIKAKVPALPDDLRTKLNGYITEHLQAFVTSKVLQPLSPRGFLGLANSLVFFTSVIPDRKEAVRQALASSVLDRASVQDRVVLKGLADRVFG